MQRRGRHRKSDAAIDAAIFSMLLSGRHLTAMTVHRELLKNPRYNLSERTVRRRMNEFLEFQRSRNTLSSSFNADHSLLTDNDSMHFKVILRVIYQTLLHAPISYHFF
ncbi:unnamed protein product [Anisakis simplex]|uniref:HTH_Tnp_Tc3_1 domain-containing protein n=1 Tax=Anisakis simplex TaxID=6269 RepID=A0A0M3JQ75_ANISI|nr:unnamed protein product [Anisakis simplex]